jgi:hypothetical protein
MPPVETERRQVPPDSALSLFILPPPQPKSTRVLRPLWRDLIKRVWGEDPLIRPCCKGTMSRAAVVAARQTATKEWP